MLFSLLFTFYSFISLKDFTLCFSTLSFPKHRSTTELKRHWSIHGASGNPISEWLVHLSATFPYMESCCSRAEFRPPGAPSSPTHSFPLNFLFSDNDILPSCLNRQLAVSTNRQARIRNKCSKCVSNFVLREITDLDVKPIHGWC